MGSVIDVIRQRKTKEKDFSEVSNKRPAGACTTNIKRNELCNIAKMENKVED